MIEKIGGLWWDGDRLIADPRIRLFQHEWENNSKFRDEIIDEVIKTNPFIQKLAQDKNEP